MHVSYDSIEFKILVVSDYVRQAVYTDDWTTYLYDHVAIRGLCWLNEAATAKLFDVPTEIKEKGFTNDNTTSPVSTELFLVNRLLVPRKRLEVWLNSDDADPVKRQYILVSPFPGRQSDARFGPQCRVHGVRPDHGNASLVADLEFHTDINPIESNLPGSSAAPPIVLSNRWTYRVSYDPQNYAEIRVIEGEAHVRLDTLADVKFNPDKLSPDKMRAHLVPKVPDGYQRETPVFELSSGGDVLRYVVVDRQKPMSEPLAGRFSIAHMEVSEERKYVSDPLTNIVDGVIPWMADKAVKIWENIKGLF